MTVNFQQVREQIKMLGEKALQRSIELKQLRQLAIQVLETNAQQTEFLIDRVGRVAQIDPSLRCALPCTPEDRPPEPLNFHILPPKTLPIATLLSADGSQINPDRHGQVNYCLINVGAIQSRTGSPEAPRISIKSQLLYDDELVTDSGILNEAQVALMRDLNERKRLVEMAKDCPPPVISFTDGPMELWGGNTDHDRGSFDQKLSEYLDVLTELCSLGVTTAGYVDKPSANLVVCLLEIAALKEWEIHDARNLRPFRQVSDRSIFQELLEPGERSAVFAIQSRSTEKYQGELKLHFFYLNVGRPGHPWLARVEIPGWVANDKRRMSELHSILFQQCQILGSRPYPYLIHRAHEAAVVTLEEKKHVTDMIVAEYYARGAPVDSVSSKQFAKDSQPRTSYER